jgi:hypothetical protein
MTDGDDGMPEAGTAAELAALTQWTAPPLAEAPGPGWGRGAAQPAAPETGTPVDVPEPWRRSCGSAVVMIGQ